MAAPHPTLAVMLPVVVQRPEICKAANCCRGSDGEQPVLPLRAGA